MAESDARDDEQARKQQTALGHIIHAALREAVVRCTATDEPCPPAEEVIRSCANAARVGSIKPEHVVTLIRTAWYEQLAPQVPTVDHDPRLIQLIGIALDAYFADDDSPESRQASDRPTGNPPR